MCSYCYEGHVDFDPRNGIVYDDEFEVYNQNIETSSWDEYDDDFYIETLRVVNYCPMCGRKLEQDESQLSNVTQKMIEVKGNEMLVIVMEELSELIQATSKLKRGKPNLNNLAEEIADTLICIEVIKKISGISETDINKWKEYKLKRSLGKIKEGTFK